MMTRKTGKGGGVPVGDVDAVTCLEAVTDSVVLVVLPSLCSSLLSIVSAMMMTSMRLWMEIYTRNGADDFVVKVELVTQGTPYGYIVVFPTVFGSLGFLLALVPYEAKMDV